MKERKNEEGGLFGSTSAATTSDGVSNLARCEINWRFNGKEKKKKKCVQCGAAVFVDSSQKSDVNRGQGGNVEP